MEDKCKWIFEYSEVSYYNSPHDFEMIDCISYITSCGVIYSETDKDEIDKIERCPHCGKLIEYKEY